MERGSGRNSLRMPLEIAHPVDNSPSGGVLPARAPSGAEMGAWTMFEGRGERDGVSFSDIILYLKLFRHSLAPPAELPPLIWGMPLDLRRHALDFPVVSPAEVARSWGALALEQRVALARGALDLGVHPLALGRFLGPGETALIAALAARRRRGRPVSGRQIFRCPARAAHANAFLDALRLQLFAERLGARHVLSGFATAFAAYRDVVDIPDGRLAGDDAWAVTMSAVSGEIVALPCHQSRCWYYAHRDFARGVAPWLSLGRRPLTIADRVRFFLLYFVAADERPTFSAEDVARAGRLMVEGSARWRDGGRPGEK